MWNIECGDISAVDLKAGWGTNVFPSKYGIMMPDVSIYYGYILILTFEKGCCISVFKLRNNTHNTHNISTNYKPSNVQSMDMDLLITPCSPHPFNDIHKFNLLLTFTFLYLTTRCQQIQSFKNSNLHSSCIVFKSITSNVL